MAGLPRDPHYLREAVSLCIAAGVFVVWATVTLVSLFLNRPVDGQLHVIMLTVVGSLLGTAGVAAWRGGKNGKPENGT